MYVNWISLFTEDRLQLQSLILAKAMHLYLVIYYLMILDVKKVLFGQCSKNHWKSHTDSLKSYGHYEPTRTEILICHSTKPIDRRNLWKIEMWNIMIWNLTVRMTGMIGIMIVIVTLNIGMILSLYILQIALHSKHFKFLNKLFERNFQ